MKENIKGHINNYFDLYKGREAYLSDMPIGTEHVVFQLLDSGEAIGQYVLPILRPTGDMLVKIPWRVAERKRKEERRIEGLRKELANE